MKNGKVLFVCSANVGRSQMAEAFYDQIRPSEPAESAGASARLKGYDGHRIGDVWPTGIKVMQEMGFDISDNKSKQLTKEAVDKADIVVFMAAKREIPNYLEDSPKLRVWDITDPAEKGHDGTRDIALQIRGLVVKLVLDMIARA